MDMAHDYVEYNDIIVRVRDKLKELNLSISTYRNYRIQGMKPQEAFDKCLLNLPQMIIYEGESYPVRSKIKELGLGLRTYERKVKNGFTPQEAFDYVLDQKMKKDKIKMSGLSKNSVQKNVKNGFSVDEAIQKMNLKKEEDQARLESYRAKGLPLYFSSLAAYCDYKAYNYRSILYLMEMNPNLDLEKIEKLYLASNNNYVGRQRYLFYGIPLKTLCLKYDYPYESCLKNYKQNGDILKTLLYMAINRMNFTYSVIEQVKALAPHLSSCPDGKLLDYMADYNIPKEYFTKIFYLKEIHLRLQRDFLLYEMNYLLEEKKRQIYASYDKVTDALYNEEMDIFIRELGLSANDLMEIETLYLDLDLISTKDGFMWKYKKIKKRNNL